MPSDPSARAADPADHARLRAFIAAAQGELAAQALDRHLARPRYRPQFTRIAERDGAIIGYALIGHERRRMGAATIDTGVIERLYAGAAHPWDAQEALMGGCLETLADQALPLATLRGPAELTEAFGFAPYRLVETTRLARGAASEMDAALRAVDADDLADLAALYEAGYRDLPLSEVRAAPDWRAWFAGRPAALALEERGGRLAGYAVIDERGGELCVLEGGAADSGAARALCAALLARGAGASGLRLDLPAAHPLARAALHMGAVASLAAPRQDPQDGGADMAGVVDLPAMLEALAPEFERRLARSRYADWSGNLRVELLTERITVTVAARSVSVIDGSRPADVRLRNITLPAIAQLCLGYRDAADLRATGGLACDDAALGLIDTLFPTV